MQVSIEAPAGLQRRMRVQVPANRVEEAVAARLQTVGRQAKIQGFRPGKVPAKVIRQRFGGQVRQEVLQEILQSTYSEALEQEKLRPAGGPTIEPESLEEGKDLAYVAVFEVYPEFQPQGFDRIKVEQPQVEITAADIEGMVDNLRKQRATWKAVDRKSCSGDRLTINFIGTLKGEPFEGGTAEGFEVVLGEGALLDDFEKNLTGLTAGAEKSFKVKFPQDYHAPDLAGAKADFAVTVREVAERVLPELDDAFVKAYGLASGAVEDLRQDIAKNMQRELHARIKAEIKRQIMEGLLEQNPIDIPDVLVQQECQAMQQETMSRAGISDPAQAPDPSGFREMAGKRVRLGLLLGAIVREQSIVVDRARVTARVDEMVAPYENPDQIRSVYMQNPQLLAQVENVVIEEQVVDWLQQQAVIATKKTGFRALMESRG